MTRKPNFWKCIMGVLVLALLFIGTLASTNALRSSAQDKTQDKAQAAPSAPSPTPTPTPAPQPQSIKNVFEAFDGDAANDPNVVGEDWNTINPIVNPAGGGTDETPPFGTAIIRTFVYDPAIASDFIFTGGGTKDFNNLDQWSNVQRGTGPDKDDVEHAFAAKYIDTTGVQCTGPNTPSGCNPTKGNQLLVFGGDRPTSNGDANIGFWFFQNPVEVGPNGTFVDDSGNPAQHTDGDIFVLSAFTGGGGTSTIRVLKWISSPSQCTASGAFIDSASGGTLCDITGTATAVGSGATNSPVCAGPGKCPSSSNPDVGIPVVWPYQNKDNKTDCPGNGTICNIPSPDFFEGGIDLTALGLQNECFAAFMLETRSSASVSAVLKDFALGSFQSCKGECNKTVNLGEVCEGTPSTFTYSTSNTGGATLGQTLKDDNATPSDTTDDFYITGKDGAGVCTTGSSPVTISVAAGGSFSCTRTVTLGVGTHIDTLTVHTVSPFEGAVADCTHSATVKVDPNPSATPTSLELCETTVGGGTAVFNLTNAESTVIGNQTGVSVTWFSDQALTQSINTPGAFQSGNGGTVYAKVTTTATGCSNSAAVTLKVDPDPTATGTSAEACETTTGGGQATFNLTNLSGTVSNNAAGVSVTWFSNAALTQPILTPSSFTTITTTVYARVSNNTTGCFNSAAVTLTVNPNPVVTINNFACTLTGSAVLTASVSSGTGSFTYIWKKNGAVVAADAGHPDQLTVSTIGNYTVDVTDGKSCVAAQASRTVGLCTSCSP